MTEAIKTDSPPLAGSHAAEIIKPLVALAESRAATLAVGAKDMADRAVNHVQATMAELGDTDERSNDSAAGRRKPPARSARRGCRFLRK